MKRIKTSLNSINKSIDLSFLQFYSFNLNKNINNLIKINGEQELKEEIIKKDFYIKLEHIFRQEKITNHLKRQHQYNKNANNIFWEILKKCHPETLDAINDYILEGGRIKKIYVHQFDINKKTRCIYLEKNRVMYPILFDLKHCIYINGKKGYDNNAKAKKTEWNFKDEEEELKTFLLSFDKNRKKV